MTSTMPAVEATAPPTSIAEIDAAISAVIATDPCRTWRADTLIDATGIALVDVLVALARLTHAGRVERTGPGRYRYPTDSAEATAARMRRRVLGDH